jgi:DNA-binding NarL/FixJ family response regulator
LNLTDCQYRGKKEEMPQPFSPHELLLLTHLKQGSNARKIAVALGKTEAAAHMFLKRLYRKLGVENRSQARAWATNAGPFSS